MESRFYELPPHTSRCVEKQLELFDKVEEQIKKSERQIQAIVHKTLAMQLLKSLPGVGMILAVVIAMEVGDVNRYAVPEKLAAMPALFLG